MENVEIKFYLKCPKCGMKWTGEKTSDGWLKYPKSCSKCAEWRIGNLSNDTHINYQLIPEIEVKPGDLGDKQAQSKPEKVKRLRRIDCEIR